MFNVVTAIACYWQVQGAVGEGYLQNGAGGEYLGSVLTFQCFCETCLATTLVNIAIGFK